ncbi:hypothetical protein [Micromonospora sp. CPCC 206061]|uniref:hypothetical protein n=1 Tax=Micromonospora sp. CPCC 206061 TaxID=3122410 RepID=UPI002FF017ED
MAVQVREGQASRDHGGTGRSLSINAAQAPRARRLTGLAGAGTEQCEVVMAVPEKMLGGMLRSSGV